MRYVGIDETFDAKSEDTIKQRVFSYSLKNDDYLLSHYITWNVVLTEFEFLIGGNKFVFPSSIYLFCGDGEGVYDWFRVDEMIDRNIGVFTMSCDFRNWEVASHQIVDNTTERVYMPQTKNIVPVADSLGKSFVLMSYSDPHRHMGESGFSNPFTV